ncbi:hypothetical protein C8J56DRAFT_426109 [Mycena floridula]|nr:hypothetical protein C8J56DRAFT_426109 [Mycena floridula]
MRLYSRFSSRSQFAALRPFGLIQPWRTRHLLATGLHRLILLSRSRREPKIKTQSRCRPPRLLRSLFKAMVSIKLCSLSRDLTKSFDSTLYQLMLLSLLYGFSALLTVSTSSFLPSLVVKPTSPTILPARTSGSQRREHVQICCQERSSLARRH